MIIYGSELSKTIKEQIRKKAEEYAAQGKRKPCLSVILVGDNPASQSYVRSKAKGCADAGLDNRTITLDGNITQQKLEEVIRAENENPEVDGILLQLPLPQGLDADRAIQVISPAKDVDGLHPVNAGALLLGRKGFVPCTPRGVMEILRAAGLEDLSGKRAVVCGRSNLVGKPLSLLLQKANATVTTVHSKTPDMKKICSEADILVAAMGVPEMITEEYVKDGAVVIDVGINRVEGKLKGDVNFERVRDKASVITPVPKGVGPMTVCMLLDNTLKAYENRGIENE